MAEGIGLEAVMDMAQFDKGQRRYMASLDAMDKKTSGASRMISGAFKMIGGVASGIIGAQLISGIGREVKSLISDAREIPSVAAAFESLGGSIERMREGALGMVTDVELMKSFNLAAGLVSKDFAEKLPDAMQYLAKVSAATGTSMSYMIDSLVKGVGRMSPMILDNLGIQVSLASATEKAADMFGVQTDALSKAQQQAGMMAMVMEKLRDNTAAMPEVVGTAAHEMASLNTIVENLKNELGVGLIPVFSELLQAIIPVAQEFGEALRTEEFREGMAKVTDIVRDVLQYLKDLDPEIVTFIKRLGTAAIAVGALTTAFTLLTGPVGIVVTSLGLLTVAMDKIKKHGEELAATHKSERDQLIETSQTYEEYKQAMVDMLREQWNIPARIDDTDIALQGLNRSTILSVAGWNVLTGRIDLAGRYMDETARSAKFLADELQFEASMATETAEALSEDVLATLRLVETTGMLIPVLQELPGPIQDAIDMMVKLKDAEDFSDFVKEIVGEAAGMAFELQQNLQKAFSNEVIVSLLSKRASITAKHYQKMGQLQDQHTRKLADLRFRFDMQQAEAEARFQQEHEALMATGHAEDAAALQIKFDNQQIASEQQYSRDQQLQQRNYLLQQIQQKRAYAVELSEMRDQTLRRLMETVKAQIAEGGKITWYQAWKLKQIAAAGSKMLQIETNTFIASLRAQEEYGEKRITLTEKINRATAAVAAGEQEAQEAITALQADLAALEAELSTGFELPPIDTSDFRDSAEEISKPTERAMTKLVDDMTQGIQSILKFEEVLEKMMALQEEFVAEEVPDISRWTVRFEGVMRQVVASIRRVLYLFEAEEAKTLAKLASDMARMYEAVIRDFSDIKEYDLPDMASWSDQIFLISKTIIDTLEDLVVEFTAEGLVNARGWAQSVGIILGLVKDAVDAIEEMAEYKPAETLAADMENLADRIIEVLPELKRVAEEYQREGWRSADVFGRAVASILGIIKPAIEAIYVLRDFEPVGDMEQAAKDLVADLTPVIDQLDLLADSFEGRGIIETGKFADAVGKILAIIKPAIQAIYDLRDYEPGRSVLEEIDDLRCRLSEIVGHMDLLADAFVDEGIPATGKFAVAVGQILAIIKPAIDAIYALREYEPGKAVLIEMINLTQRLSEIIGHIDSLADAWQDKGIPETAKFADAVVKIVGLIQPAIDAIKALWEYEPGRAVLIEMINLMQRLSEIIGHISSMALSWKDKGIPETAKFATAVTEIVGLIRPAIDALKALWEYEPGRAVLIEMINLMQRLSEIIGHISSMALSWKDKGIPETAKFATAVTEIVGLIKPAIDAIYLLRDYEPVVGLTDAMGEFADQLYIVLDELDLLAGEFAERGIPESKAFWEATDKMLGTVSAGVDALKDLTEYEPVDQLETLMADFKIDLDAVLTKMMELAKEFEGKGVEESTKFFQAANVIFGSVSTGVDILIKLMEYEPATDLKDKVDEFKADIGYFLFWMTKLASDMKTTNMGAAQEFWVAADGIFSGVSKGLDTISKLREYPQFGGCFKCFVDMLVGDLGYLIFKLTKLASDMKTTNMGAAQEFWVAANGIFTKVDAGLELIAKLRATSFGVRDKMDEFKQDVLDIVGALADASDEISDGGLLRKARNFESQLEEIAGAMQAGLSTIAGIAGFTAEVDVSVIEQFIYALATGIDQAQGLTGLFLETVEEQFKQSVGDFYNLGYASGSAWLVGFEAAAAGVTAQIPTLEYDGRARSATGGGTNYNTFNTNVASGMDLAAVRQTVQDAMRRP